MVSAHLERSNPAGRRGNEEGLRRRFDSMSTANVGPVSTANVGQRIKISQLTPRNPGRNQLKSRPAPPLYLFIGESGVLHDYLLSTIRCTHSPLHSPPR